MPVILIYSSIILLQIHVEGFHVDLIVYKTTNSAISNSDIFYYIYTKSQQTRSSYALYPLRTGLI